ncbi:hypothetical protein LTR97_002286 [Elasticomyces elasticus]|uniref:Uncharacterized protein n=1 Tax=Elasticomyces elasticus TaxID=574655 RepID=A0AAN7WAN0_9PEZI|nr:hypothetical protein LTR97_002286 [Elasticomyces elasticus]
MVSAVIRRSAFTLRPRIAFKHAVFQASDTTTHLSCATFTSTATRSVIRSRLANLLGVARPSAQTPCRAHVPNVLNTPPASSRAPSLTYSADENATLAFTSHVDVERSFYPTLALCNELKRTYMPTQSHLTANPDPSTELEDSLRQLAISGTSISKTTTLTGLTMAGGSHALVKIADLRVTRQEWKVIEKQRLGRMSLKLVKDRVHTERHLLLNDIRIEHVSEFTGGEHIEEHQRLKRKAVEGMRRTSAEFLARHPTLFKPESALEDKLYLYSKGVLGAYLDNLTYRKREWDNFPVAWKRKMELTTQEEYEKSLESDG